MSAQVPLPAIRRLWLYALVAGVLTFLVLPIFIVVPLSFSDTQFFDFPPRRWSLRWYKNYFSTPEWMAATRVSLTAGLLTTAIATPLGIAAAYAINLLPPRVARLFQLMMLLPMIIPVILIGIGIFYLYIRVGLVNTMTGIVIAHTLLAIPFVVVTSLAALRSFDLRQEQVARSLGAPRFWAFMHVTLPQIRPSVLSAALLTFIISIDEVVIGLFVAGGQNTLLTRRMFLGLRDSIDPTIAAISAIFVCVSLAALALVGLTINKNRK